MAERVCWVALEARPRRYIRESNERFGISMQSCEGRLMQNNLNMNWILSCTCRRGNFEYRDFTLAKKAHP